MTGNIAKQWERKGKRGKQWETEGNGGKHGKRLWLTWAEIRVRQMSMQLMGGVKEKEESTSRSENLRVHSKGFKGTTSALVADTTRGVRCHFCDGEHHDDQCREYPDAKSRVKQATGKCFSCLMSGHSARDCESGKRCYHCKKTGHHRSLCYQKFPSKSAQCTPIVSMSASHDSSSVKSPIPTSEILSHSESTYLSTGLVDVRTGCSGNKSLRGRCFLDSGESRSFVTTEFCRSLNSKVVGEDVLLAVAGFKDYVRKTAKYMLVELELLFSDGNGQVGIDILIGNDYYYDVVGSSRVTLEGGPTLISSRLGYIVADRVQSDDVDVTSNTSVMVCHGVQGAKKSTFDLEQFWNLEDIGIREQCERSDDTVALEKFNASVRFSDGRYEVAWPWKQDPPELSDNFQLAFGRLKSLMKRIGHDDSVMKQYKGTIEDQLAKGVIEPAPEVPDSSLVHYIPHHCVLTPNKETTKLRIVYDASAKSSSSSPSVNELLYRGPVLLSDLCGLLLRFRMWKYAVVSDIEKAFLQVGLQMTERDVTRFLWLKDTSKPVSVDNLTVFRFTRVPFGFISSLFLLVATVLHHLLKVGTETSKKIADDLYVGNVVSGCDDTTVAISYYKEAKSYFQSAGMNLREWYSNNAELMETVSPADRGKASIPKVLGLAWDLKTDTLKCCVGVVDVSSVQTKRQILQAIAKSFDPCGYICPVTIRGKMIMQELWQLKCDWDTVVDVPILGRWKEFYEEFVQINDCSIPRRLTVDYPKETTKLELHCFCDASSRAYSAAVYLRVVTDKVECVNLVFAKSRVAPVKKLTIPRLELVAVTIGCRLVNFVEKQLCLGSLRKRVWSDSKCVLCWISSDKVSTVFVENRLREIRDSGVEFAFVGTKENPADLPIRGCSTETLMNSSVWWNGPDFLSRADSEWPDFKPSDVTSSDDSEVGQNAVQLLVQESHPNVLNPQKVSSFSKLVRITAWVFRFMKCLRAKQKITGSLTAEEVAKSRCYWIQQHQSIYFRGVLEGSHDSKSKALNQQLNLFVDESGIIRSRGRIENSSISEESKFPALLASSGHITRLVVQSYYKRVLHDGVSVTLAAIRQQYWIPRGRSEVRSEIKRCQVCRKVQDGPFLMPSWPPLPEFRVAGSPPFACTGVDYLGPLFIRTGPGENQKVWICLFTCATTRAIHLEIANSLSTEEFLLCLRRFSASCGVPKLMISDNGTQFKSADKLLVKLWQEIVNSDGVMDYSAQKSISWKFIPELSPWMVIGFMSG